MAIEEEDLQILPQFKRRAPFAPPKRPTESQDKARELFQLCLQRQTEQNDKRKRTRLFGSPQPMDDDGVVEGDVRTMVELGSGLLVTPEEEEVSPA